MNQKYSIMSLFAVLVIGLLLLVNCKQTEVLETNNTNEHATPTQTNTNTNVKNANSENMNDNEIIDSDDDWDDDGWGIDDDEEIQPNPKNIYRNTYVDEDVIVNATCCETYDIFKKEYLRALEDLRIAKEFWTALYKVESLHLLNAWISNYEYVGSVKPLIPWVGVELIRMKMAEIYDILVRENKNFAQFNEEHNSNYTTIFKTFYSIALKYENVEKVTRPIFKRIFDFCIKNELFDITLDFYSMSFLARVGEKLDKADYDKIVAIYEKDSIFKKRFEKLDRILGFYKPEPFSFDLIDETDPEDMFDFFEDYMVELKKESNAEKLWQILSKRDIGSLGSWLIEIEVHAIHKNDSKPEIPMTDSGKKLIESKLNEFIKTAQAYLNGNSEITGRNMTDWDYMYSELVSIMVLYEDSFGKNVTDKIDTFFKFCMSVKCYGHMDVLSAWYLVKRGRKISKEHYEKMMKAHDGNWRLQGMLVFISKNLKEE